MKRIVVYIMTAFLVASSAWPCTLAMAENLTVPEAGIRTVEEAEAFAASFFSNPYVEVTYDSLECIPKCKNGYWMCTAKYEDDEHLTYTLLFNTQGKIVQYINENYPVTNLDGIRLDLLSDMIDAQMGSAIDALCDSIFSYDVRCSGIIIEKIHHDGDVVYTLLGEDFNSILNDYFVIKAGSTLSLVGFGDLRHPVVKFGQYLSGGEVIEIAKRAILNKYDLSESEYEELAVTQTEFVTSPGYFNELPIEVPFWFLAFNDGTPSPYELCIDAQTGAVLELWNHEDVAAG